MFTNRGRGLTGDSNPPYWSPQCMPPFPTTSTADPEQRGGFFVWEKALQPYDAFSAQG